jgi:hypothetical protein
MFIIANFSFPAGARHGDFIAHHWYEVDAGTEPLPKVLPSKLLWTYVHPAGVLSTTTLDVVLNPLPLKLLIDGVADVHRDIMSLINRDGITADPPVTNFAYILQNLHS